MLFMLIQCKMSFLSRCIVGHPTRVNLISLSRGNQFHRSIKGAYNCMHSRARSLLFSPPLRSSLSSVGRTSVRL